MYTADSTYRVLYADTDQMGFMYYGQYPKLYEIGRVEALRALGVSYTEVEAAGIFMPVYGVEARYLEPALYDEVLCIKTSLKELPGARIVFYCNIFNAQNKPIHEAKVTLVFLGISTKKLQKCPDLILDKLKPYFNV